MVIYMCLGYLIAVLHGDLHVFGIFDPSITWGFTMLYSILLYSTPLYSAMADSELKAALVTLGFLQHPSNFLCPTHRKGLSWKNGCARCTAYKCTYKPSDTYYSPMFNTSLTVKQYGSLAYSYSLGTPADAAGHYAPDLQAGGSGDKKVYKVYQSSEQLLLGSS